MATRPEWTLLHARLHQILKERTLLQRQTGVLIAVSGGQDSHCLLKLLVDLQPKWGWRLAIAHCDHRWAVDVGNPAFVGQLADQYQLPYYEQKAEQITTQEAEARRWRYQVLADIATTHGFQQVVTGHTASDRAETLLYNLLRGSGMDGLQALRWRRLLAPGVQLVRPLLTVTRMETGQFCQDWNLDVWNDQANTDLGYARARIRQELLPYLETRLNPQAVTQLAQTAELLQADVEYLEQQAHDLRLYSCADAPVPSAINRRRLQSAPLALQRRVVRQVLQQLLPTAPNFEQIEKLVMLIEAPNRSQTDPFPGGAIARVNQDWIEFYT